MEKTALKGKRFQDVEDIKQKGDRQIEWRSLGGKTKYNE
jgi:hypothetical protein